MSVLVIYESFFENTANIARAIGQGMDGADVTVVRVQDAEPGQVQQTDLLVAGSPTRGFRPTEGILEFIWAIDRDGLAGKKVAAFDTRIALDTIDSKFLRFAVNTGGYAAKRIARKLIRKGGEQIAPPEGFVVTGKEGPLQEGELERAAEWGASLIGITSPAET